MRSVHALPCCLCQKFRWREAHDHRLQIDTKRTSERARDFKVFAAAADNLQVATQRKKKKKSRLHATRLRNSRIRVLSERSMNALREIINKFHIFPLAAAATAAFDFVWLASAKLFFALHLQAKLRAEALELRELSHCAMPPFDNSSYRSRIVVRASARRATPAQLCRFAH